MEHELNMVAEDQYPQTLTPANPNNRCCRRHMFLSEATVVGTVPCNPDPHTHILFARGRWSPAAPSPYSSSALSSQLRQHD
ncbi:hypothetical protein HaLaN_28963 [Haematococcus lacustris]|uniref:Uncharacterized protein n=1 Tax=Haematococcus lacustris TaxID=44745 RepID=A0A6A0ABN8_HAELA|nr:hypothetical protein HaLaN_28963 [Haematococcus lacustris]